MGEVKHTPGPWNTIIWPTREKEYIRIFSGNTYIGSVGNSDDPFERTEANARLIATAPKMLAALEAVTSAGEAENLPEHVYDAVQDAIDEATNKDNQ